MGRLLQLLAAPITRFLGGLRYPVLFAIVAAIFVLDLIVPDLIPFADEVLLGLATLLVAGRRKKPAPAPPPSDAPESR